MEPDKYSFPLPNGYVINVPVEKPNNIIIKNDNTLFADLNVTRVPDCNYISREYSKAFEVVFAHIIRLPWVYLYTHLPIYIPISTLELFTNVTNSFQLMLFMAKLIARLCATDKFHEDSNYRFYQVDVLSNALSRLYDNYYANIDAREQELYMYNEGFKIRRSNPDYTKLIDSFIRTRLELTKIALGFMERTVYSLWNLPQILREDSFTKLDTNLNMIVYSPEVVSINTDLGDFIDKNRCTIYKNLPSGSMDFNINGPFYLGEHEAVSDWNYSFVRETLELLKNKQ